MHQTESKITGISVHAGFPNPATDANPENLRLEELLIAHPVSTFFLRIRGRQWEERGIFDGDLAIVDRAIEARPADLVIWWKEDTFLISQRKLVPGSATLWGIVTSIVHQYRKS